MRNLSSSFMNVKNFETRAKYKILHRCNKKFLQKIHYCSYLGKRAKIWYFILFLKKFFSWLSWKVWKDNYYDTWLSIPNSMSGKILGLELLSKILSIDEILKDFWTPNISRISREIKLIFCESQINWPWSDMDRPVQIISKLYIKNIFKRQIWSSVLCVLNPHKQRVL